MDNDTAWPLKVCLGGSCLRALTLLQSLHFFPVCHLCLPAVVLVLNPRGGGSVEALSSCGSSKRSLLITQQSLPPPQPPLVFTARSDGDLSWHWNAGLLGALEVPLVIFTDRMWM